MSFIVKLNILFELNRRLKYRPLRGPRYLLVIHLIKVVRLVVLVYLEQRCESFVLVVDAGGREFGQLPGFESALKMLLQIRRRLAADHA